MDNFLDKVRYTAESTAYKLGVRTSSAWNRAKYNKRIIELRADISKGYKKLGRRYYEMWIAEKVNFDEVDNICQSILDKEDMINGIKLEIRELVRKEQSKIDHWNSAKEKPVTYNVVSDIEEYLPADNGAKPDRETNSESGYTEPEYSITDPESGFKDPETESAAPVEEAQDIN